jgi:PAS domain S-box-containing protein
MNRRLPRLSLRMVLVGLCAALPALTMILYEQASDRAQARADAVENALRLARLAAEEQAAVLGGVNRLLSTLALFPALQDDDPAACRALLPAVLRDHRAYINLFVVRGDGMPFCLAKPLQNPSNDSPAHSTWFVRTIGTRAFTFGEPQISRTNGKPDVVLAQPIVGRSGRIERVVAAAVGLDQLNAAFGHTRLPAGATMALTDREGKVLARMPASGGLIGRQHPNFQSLRELASDGRTAMRESAGTDGVTRMFTVIPLPTEIDSGLFVTLDIESSAVFPAANRLLLRHTILFGFAAICAVIAVLVGTRRLVVKPVDAMRNEIEQERDIAEQARHDTEERMRFALDAAHVGVWEANLKTAVAYWNETSEAMHGLPQGTFGRSLSAFLDCVHQDDRARVIDTIERATAEHQNAELEYRTIWPDGTERRIAATCRFFYEDDGTPARGAGVSIDVTEQRSLEEQFRQAQKMEAVGRLAGGIAHDFNNMLMAILGNAELLLDQLPKGDRKRADVDEITKAAQRAAALTHQLLAFSRKQILAPKVLHLGDVVTGVAPMLRRLLGESIDLRTTVADRHHVKADAGQLEQVLMNLSVNARDAMKDGGRLTIETSDVELDAAYVRVHPRVQLGRYVMVAISDTGHGMDASTKKRIFEPFFTTKPVGQGTGLGLATVYGIVEQSGGHIAVDTEPGHGTTFMVYLPETDEAPPVAADVRRLDAPRGDERILLVEDEMLVRELVTRVLTRQGYHVDAIDSPARAIAFADAHRSDIDLILTDVVLPGMSGPAMITELRDHLVAPAVIYMSGYTDDATVTVRSLGPDAVFLQKPFTSGDLATTVRTVLDRAAVV